MAAWVTSFGAAQAGDEIKPEIKISAEQISRIGIEVESVSEHAAVPKLRFPARVIIPLSQIRIVSAPVAGRLDSIEVTVDSSVKQGQVLARLSGPAWIRAQSELVQAVKQQQFLRSTLDREQSLTADRIVSPKQFQATQNEFAQAQASVAEKRNALKMSGLSEADIDALVAKGGIAPALAITAPLDAAVLEVSAIAGQATEAMTPLFRLASLSPLWLEIQVPVVRVEKLGEGDAVTVPPDLGSGKIISIANSVDPVSQTVLVRAEITPLERKLRPQQVVEAEITQASGATKAWAVHPSAVIRRDGKTYVFVQTPGGFRAQEVVVKEETADLTIFGGPFVGSEAVATKGLVSLKGAWQGLGGSEEK